MVPAWLISSVSINLHLLIAMLIKKLGNNTNHAFFSELILIILMNEKYNNYAFYLFLVSYQTRRNYTIIPNNPDWITIIKLLNIKLQNVWFTLEQETLHLLLKYWLVPGMDLSGVCFIYSQTKISKEIAGCKECSPKAYCL